MNHLSFLVFSLLIMFSFNLKADPLHPEGWRSPSLNEIELKNSIFSKNNVYSHYLVGDYNNDGNADILLTDFSGKKLYRNEGDGTFLEVTEIVGITGSGPNLPIFLDFLF